MVSPFLPVLSGADLIVIFKRGRKMLDRGITQGFGYGGNAPAAVRQQDGCGGHTGLRFFLEKGFAVMLLQKPLCLPGSQPVSYTHLFIVDAADYITEMRCIRHPFEKGIPARKGVEF